MDLSTKYKHISVILLAAGRGERMRHLTETKPKPLLVVGRHSLIEHHLRNLAKLGFRDIVINLAYLGEQIERALGDGRNYGLSIRYSREPAGALETAGGIQHALALINSDPFIVINADIYTDFLSAQGIKTLLRPLKKSARLVMVENPHHKQYGDFALDKYGLLQHKSDGSPNTAGQNSHTFSGIALYQKSIFENLERGRKPLAPVLRSMIDQQALEGDLYTGHWADVGTPERLAELNEQKYAPDPSA